MRHREFFKNMVATVVLITASYLSVKATDLQVKNQKKNVKQEIATFGAVHLNVTNLQRSVSFWRDNIGMKVRNTTAEYTEMGTNTNTLVVLYPTAKTGFKQGYSGIYHLAIHPSSEGEFARVLARLLAKRYPISPTDHTMSKAIYMEDPDGITVEVTLETPERLAKIDFNNSNGPVAIDRDGTVRSPSAPLDVEAVLKTLPDKDITKGLPDDTKVGHMHLYVSNLDANNQFYKNLGFVQNMYEPRYGAADLGAGGAFGHRIAVNTWQGNKPQAPEGTAGMRFFTIIFDTPDRLKAALKLLPNAKEDQGGYLVSDPAGNKILLKAARPSAISSK
jgi:catechol 2,3-dioxygenase